MGQDYGEKIDGGWYSDETHCYRDETGRVLPSATGVFDALGLVDFSGIHPDVVEWKRLFGSAVHKAVEFLVFGKLDWDTCDERIIPAVTGVEAWMKQVGYVPVAAEEKRVISFNGMKVGGTLDHRGSLVYKGQRRPCILDLKTATKYSSTWPWQVGCYSAGAPKPEGGMYIGCALQVDKEGGVTPYWVDTLKAKSEFQILLAAANLAANAKLIRFKNTEEE